MPMALHGKNGFEVVKINIRALPIIFRKWRPCVVLLSRTASPSPAVIAVTVKIQIGRMTVIGHGDGKEVVWRRF